MPHYQEYIFNQRLNWWIRFQEKNGQSVTESLASLYTVHVPANSLQLCSTLCDPNYGLQPTRLLCPWDFPGKNTEVAMPPTGDLPNPETEPMALALSGRSFTISATWEAPLYTDGELNPRDKILGETEKDSFIALQGKGSHTGLPPWKLCVSTPENLMRVFITVGQMLGLTRSRRVVCLLILMTFSVPF